ncbi:hypothetical protein D8M29_11990, partial [Micrococcus sp. HSID17227]
GMYRDAVRDFWRGEPGTLGEFATRLTGSADLYEGDGRGPGASGPFPPPHARVTLRDVDRRTAAPGSGSRAARTAEASAVGARPCLGRPSRW